MISFDNEPFEEYLGWTAPLVKASPIVDDVFAIWDEEHMHRLYNRLIRSKKMTVRLPIFDGQIAVFEFNTAGLRTDFW